MTHVRLLYALLGLTYFGSALTGCVSIENYYESPSGTTAESVRYVQTSRASCPCCSRADATNTSRSYYTGQETGSGRCTHSVSSNTSETIYVVVDQNGNYYYPIDPADCPPDQRGRNPQVIYLPDRTSTPPIITHTPSYPGRERDRPIEDHIGGSNEGTVTTNRNNGREEGERPLEYWENDGLNGTVTANETTEKGEAKILEDRISGRNDAIVTTNEKKPEERKPVKDRVDGSAEGIVTAFEEEELTKVEKNGEDQGSNYRREAKVGDGTTGEQGVVSQERKSAVKQEEISATNGRERRVFGEAAPVSTTGNRTDAKVEEKKVTEPKTSSPSNLGNGNRYRAETKSSVVVEQKKSTSTSSTSLNNQKEQPKQSQQVATQQAPTTVVQERKPAQSSSSSSPFSTKKEQPKQSQQVATQQAQTTVVQERKPAQSSSSSSPVSTKKEQPKQRQQVTTQQVQTTVVQEKKPAQSSSSSSPFSAKKEEKVVSPTASTTTSSPQTSTPAESPKQSVGGTFSPQ